MIGMLSRYVILFKYHEVLHSQLKKDRSKFKTVPGLYTLLEMSYEDDDIEQIQEALGNLKVFSSFIRIDF